MNAWLKQGDGPPLQPQLHREESLLNCASCHPTTAWNDIPGVGWYKHH